MGIDDVSLDNQWWRHRLSLHASSLIMRGLVASSSKPRLREFDSPEKPPLLLVKMGALKPKRCCVAAGEAPVGVMTRNPWCALGSTSRSPTPPKSRSQALCVEQPMMIDAPSPNQTPLEMEWDSGIRAMVRKAGSATRVSAHSICPTSRIIIEPIRMSTGAEAI